MESHESKKNTRTTQFLEVILILILTALHVKVLSKGGVRTEKKD